MKKLFLVPAVLLLSACSMFTARQYDPVEYNYAIRIATNATHAAHLCKEKGADYAGYLTELNHDSFTLVEYVSNKGSSEEALVAVEQIRKVTYSFLLRPERSVSYCKHKVNNIQASARMFARAVGSSAQYDTCDSSAADRLVDFRKSYDAKAISREEFLELASDLEKLTLIDTSSCTLETKAKMAQLVSDLKGLTSLLPI